MFIKIENSKQLKEQRRPTEEEQKQIRNMAKEKSSGEGKLANFKGIDISDGQTLPNLVIMKRTGIVNSGQLNVKGINDYINTWISKNKNYDKGDRGARIQGAKAFKRVVNKLKTGTSARKYLYNTNGNGQKIITKLNEFIKKAEAVQNPSKEEPEVENTEFDNWTEAVEAMEARNPPAKFKSLQVDGVSYVYERDADIVQQYSESPGADMEAASMGYISTSFANEQDASQVSMPDEPEEEEEVTEGSYLSVGQMKKAKDEVEDAAANENYPGFTSKQGSVMETPAGKVTNHIWRAVLKQDLTKNINPENTRKAAIADYMKILEMAKKALGVESTEPTEPRIGSGPIAGQTTKDAKRYQIKGTTIILDSWSDLDTLIDDNKQAYQDSNLIIVKSSKGETKFEDAETPKGSSNTFTRAGYYDWKEKAADAGGGKGAWVRRRRSGSGKKRVYGTSQRWRPRGKDRRTQYKQFYKDLQKAGLLKLLFKKGEVRKTGRGSIENLNESDGLDFKWGGLHTKAYKELLKVVQASGAKSIEDWRAGKTSADEKPEKPADSAAAASGTTQKELERLNIKRKVTFKRYEGEYTPLTAEQVANKEFLKTIIQRFGVTQAELSKLIADKEAKTANIMKGKRADQLKRKQAALMLAREVRKLNGYIDGRFNDSEIRELIEKYASSEEFEGTGIKRNLNLLATRYQKFSGKSLIDHLVDDGHPELADMVRYGGQDLPDNVRSQGVLRGRGTDVIDPDLDDDAAALFKAARGAGTDEETIKRVIIKNKNKLVQLAQAYRKYTQEDAPNAPITDEHANLITMLYDEADGDEEKAFARRVQRALRASAAQIDTSLREGKKPMPKINLKKLKALFKEEFKRKLEEQSTLDVDTTGGMTLPSGQSIGGMSIDRDDLEQMLDEPHPNSSEFEPVSQKTTKTSRGLVYTPERKAFIRYIKGLRKRGKLSRAQEMKLRRAVFSRKYTPKDMAGKEITKLINSQVVAKMNHDQMVAKPLAGIEGALSGKKASVSDLKASLKRLQSGPQNNRTKRSIARVKRMIARAEQRGPDVDVMKIAKSALDNLGKSKTAAEMEASLKKMKSSKNASSAEMQRAIARGERMLARKRQEENPSKQVATDL